MTLLSRLFNRPKPIDPHEEIHEDIYQSYSHDKSYWLEHRISKLESAVNALSIAEYEEDKSNMDLARANYKIARQQLINYVINKRIS